MLLLPLYNTSFLQPIQISDERAHNFPNVRVAGRSLEQGRPFPSVFVFVVVQRRHHQLLIHQIVGFQKVFHFCSGHVRKQNGVLPVGVLLAVERFEADVVLGWVNGVDVVNGGLFGEPGRTVWSAFLDVNRNLNHQAQ